MADNFQYPSPYGRYTLLESIGQGGMSAIDLAQTSVTDAQYLRFVVIKRMQSQFTEQENFVLMFKDEARINAELQHTKIAQVYDFGQCGEEYFIAMEYIPGVDLRVLQRELAKQAKGIPIRITLRILADVCEALDYAHTRLDTYGRPMNVVHRDVNPRNIMISVRGEVKLIDFGVAKADNRLDKTVGHTIKGKFAYMSPEQIEGGKVDGRADLYAVALTLHELVDGRRPFAGLNEVQIMHRVLSGNIPPLTGPKDHPQPELVQAIHECALATEANDRYPSAGHMQEALVHAAKACGGLATDAEMAAFLRDIMPEETQAIAHRLDRYRKEITQPHGFMASYDQSVSHELPTELFQKEQPSIPPPPSNSPYMATGVQSSKADETLVSQKRRDGGGASSKQIILIAAAILAVAGIAFAILSTEPTAPAPEAPPATTFIPEKVDPPPQKEGTVEATPPPEKPPEIDNSQNTQTVPVAVPPPQPTPQQTAPPIPVPTPEPAAPPPELPPEPTPPPEPSSPPPSQTSQASNTQSPSSNTPPAEPTPEATADPTPEVIEPTPPPAPAVPAEQAYVYFSSASGQNDIVVKVDGQTFGTLNGTLRKKVDIGQHVFLFVNQSNGHEYRQTMTISKSNPNLISVPEL